MAVEPILDRLVEHLQTSLFDLVHEHTVIEDMGIFRDHFILRALQVRIQVLREILAFIEKQKGMEDGKES